MDSATDAYPALDGHTERSIDSPQPYRPTNPPRLWPTSGLLLRAARPVHSAALHHAIAPRCLTLPLPVRPKLSGYLPFSWPDEDGDGDEPIVYRLSNDRFSVLRLGVIGRDVPKAARDQAAKKALRAARQRNGGRELPQHEAMQVEAQAYCDLLADALIDEREAALYYLHDHALLFCGERSENGAKDSAAFFDAALDAHRAEGPKFAEPPAEVMTRWLLQAAAPAEFCFGTSALLVGNQKAKAKFDNHDLTCEEVIEHLRAGLRVQELSLIHREHVRFTLTHTGFVRGIELLGVDENPDLVGLAADFALAAVYVQHVVPAIAAVYAAIGGGFGRTGSEGNAFLQLAGPHE